MSTPTLPDASIKETFLHGMPESPEPLKVADELALVRSVLRGYPTSFASADALRALTKIEAAIQAARNEAEAMRADAERYLAFFSAGLPITFLGQSYETKEELDAAIDAMKGDAHA